MSLMTRLTTLWKADAHGALDALEDRSLVLRQHLRDAGAELDRKRCRIEALAAEEKDLGAEAERLRGEIETLERDVTLALDGAEDELARYAIRKLLPRRQGAIEIDRRLAALGEERSELAAELARQEAEHETLEARVRAQLARAEREPGARGRPWTDFAVTDEDVELELLRRRGAGTRDSGARDSGTNKGGG